MEGHAVLSPSAAQRWLACTPSARLEQEFPDKGSEAANEGTLAHSLSELLIIKGMNAISEKVYVKRIKEISANPLFDHAMREHCDTYSAYVMEQYNEALSHTKDAVIMLEEKLDLTEYVPDGFGTGDVIIIANGWLNIIDLKYGKGVPVTAENNKQMMLYSLGALAKFDLLYDIHTVVMTIYQPRLESVTTFEMKVDDLKEWAENELKPRAKMAFEGIGEFIPGAHCRFCKVRAVCKANADMNLEVAKYEFQDPRLLNENAIADILRRSKIFSDWLNSVEEYALDESVNHGKKWPGFKLVEGKSNRKYSDENAVAAKLKEEGFSEDVIYEKSLLGITKMEKEIGKKVFAAHLSELIIKPAGKPCLAPISDTRPEYNSIESAIKDFA